MEYEPKGLVKAVGWILERLFRRHYALLNYVHVSREWIRLDPSKLIINRASDAEIAEIFVSSGSVALPAPLGGDVPVPPTMLRMSPRPGESRF
jgi:hypothetical protein